MLTSEMCIEAVEKKVKLI